MNSLRQQVRDAAHRWGLPRFWRWWMGELAPLLPEASRAAFQRRFARPVIELADGEAVFWRPRFEEGATRLAVAEKLSLNGDASAVLAAGRAAVARLAEKASGGLAAPKVVIALGSRDVLRKEFSLPAAVEENLAQTLAYDLDRHTPFRPEQLYFDAVVINRDAARKMLRVDWAAALKTTVDAARRRVKEWGAVPVQIAPGPPPSPTRLNLIPETARSRPLQWRRWQVWAPIAALAIFVVAAVFVPLVQKRQYAVALNIVGAETGQQAQAAANLRTQLEGMEGDYNYILAKKYAYPSVVHVIDEVSRVLPDDTWLTQLEIKTTGRGKDVQREIYLRGESENAGKLIALLEDSKLVEQAAPRSPTTKIQGAAGEIFDLGARLRTLTPPASEQVLAGAAPIPAALVPPPAALAPAPLPAPTAPAPAADTEAEAAPAPPPTRSAPPAAAPAASGFGPFPNAPVAVPQGGQRMQRQVPLAATPQPVAPAPQTAPVPPQAAQAPARAPAATIPPPPPMPAKTPEPSTEIPPAPTMPGTAPSAPEAPPPEPQQPGATN